NTLDPLSTVLSVSHGTVSIGTTTGGAAVSSNGSGSVTLTGTAVQIDASLANASYTGSTNYTGPDSLSVTTTDTADNTQTSGSVGITVGGAATIESYGSTALVQSGNNYFMNPVAGGSGPELKYGGAPFTSGEFGPWVPIGAEATSTGYEV